MTAPARRPATYQDVLDAPEHQVAELIDAVLYLQPRPAAPHANAQSVLMMLLGPPYHLGRGGPGGWVILHEPELHLGDDVLVPDLAGWRLADHPGFDVTPAYFTAAPTWVCEVLSPSTASKDRIKKLPRYGAAGVRHAWLLDPVARTLEVFAHDGERWSLALTHEGPGVVNMEPFPAVELELGDLWPPT